MDPDLLQSFETLFKSYKDPEMINQIVEMCKELRGDDANCLDFLLGSFYGSSLYLFESFVSNEREVTDEYRELVKNHVMGLDAIFKKELGKK